MISAPGDAVDGRVVDLGQQADVVVLQSVDQVCLPQRPRAIERPLEDPRHLLGQLGIGRRRRQRDLAYVVLQIEVRILDPIRVVEVERDRLQPPAKRRQKRQPLLDHVQQVGELELPVGPRARVEHRQRSDVPRLARRFERQELRV